MIEAFTPCPTAFGRQNKIGKPLDGLSWIKDKTVDIKKAADLSEEDLDGRLITGLLTDVDRPEFTQMYENLIQTLRADGHPPTLPEREFVTVWSDGQEGDMP